MNLASLFKSRKSSGTSNERRKVAQDATEPGSKTTLAKRIAKKKSEQESNDKLNRSENDNMNLKPLKKTNVNKLSINANEKPKDRKFRPSIKIKNCKNFKNKWRILSTLCCYKCTTSQNHLMDHSSAQFKNQDQKEANQLNSKTTIANSQPNFVNRNVSNIQEKRLKYKSLSLSQNSSTENMDYIGSSFNELRNKSTSLHNAHFGLINEMGGSSDYSVNGRLYKKSLDASVCLTSPLPQVSSSVKDLPRLYPPGRILHIVRKYPRTTEKRPSEDSTVKSDEASETKLNTQTDDKSSEKRSIRHAFKEYKSSRKNSSKSFQTVSPVYQVIETDNKHFNELLISPRMLQDHIPDNLIKCMRAVLEETGPKKPQRSFEQQSLQVINEQPTSASSSVTSSDKERKKSKRRSVLESIAHSFSSNDDETKQRRNSSHSLQKFLNFSRLKNVPIVKQYVMNSNVNSEQVAEPSLGDAKFKIKENYVSASVLQNPDNDDEDFRVKQVINYQRQFKSLSLCNNELSQLTPAPLAKPESCSDLLNEIEEALTEKKLFLKTVDRVSANRMQKCKENDEFNSQACLGSIDNNENENDNNITFYDESFNFKNSLFELQNDENDALLNNQITNQERAIYRKHAIGNPRHIRSHGQHLDDDNEVKSSIIWWPYQDTNSNADTTNAAAQGNVSNKHIDGEDDEIKLSQKCSANSFKINLLGSDLDENNSNMDADDENQMNDDDDDDENATGSHAELIKNRIATSTPRGHILSLDQREHSNFSLVKEAVNYKTSAQSPNFGSLNDDINLKGRSSNSNKNKTNSLTSNVGNNRAPEIHVSLLSTSLSTNESDMNQDGDCGDDEADLNDRLNNGQDGVYVSEYNSESNLKSKRSSKKMSKKHLMSKKLNRQQSGLDGQDSTDGSSPRRSADLFSTDVNNSSNLVISSSSSASFGAINLNIMTSSSNMNGPETNANFKLHVKQIDDLIDNKIDESITNFTSIEKLSILKPQSKDYILCFDTSSIDQNSSFASIDYNHQILSACSSIPAKREHKKSLNMNELINDIDEYGHLADEHRSGFNQEEEFVNGNDLESKSVQSFNQFNHSLSNSSSNGETDNCNKLMMTSKSSTNTNTSSSNATGSCQNLNYEMLMNGNFDKEICLKEALLNS